MELSGGETVGLVDPCCEYIYIYTYIDIEREPKEAHCFALGELQNPEKHQKVSKRES